MLAEHRPVLPHRRKYYSGRYLIQEVSFRTAKLWRLSCVPSPDSQCCVDSVLLLPVIYHLVNLSGDLGLSAFLPPAESQFPVNASTVNSVVEPTPFLPLSTEWGSSNFSLSNIAFETGWPGHSRREFAMRLIQRYSYIMGSSMYLTYPCGSTANLL